LADKLAGKREKMPFIKKESHMNKNIKKLLLSIVAINSLASLQLNGSSQSAVSNQVFESKTDEEKINIICEEELSPQAEKAATYLLQLPAISDEQKEKLIIKFFLCEYVKNEQEIKDYIKLLLLFASMPKTNTNGVKVFQTHEELMEKTLEIAATVLMNNRNKDLQKAVENEEIRCFLAEYLAEEELPVTNDSAPQNTNNTITNTTATTARTTAQPEEAAAKPTATTTTTTPETSARKRKPTFKQEAISFAKFVGASCAISEVLYRVGNYFNDEKESPATATADPIVRQTTEPTVTVIPEINNDAETASFFLIKLIDMKLPELQVAIERNPTFVNARSAASSFTALQIAVRGNDMQVVQCLLLAGADVDAQNSNGWTALHIAVVKNNLEMVQLLLDNSASTFKVTNNGLTALHFAAMRDAEKLVELLGEYTDHNIIDRFENKAIDYAKKNTTRAAFMTGQGRRLLARL
jgi:hypothetical protein